MTQNHDNTTDYEAPSIEVIGTLHDLTQGGGVPVNELQGQKVVNNDAFPPITS